MFRRRVKGKQVPKDAPDDTDAAGRVENNPPSVVCDDEATQRIGQANSKTEP